MGNFLLTQKWSIHEDSNFYFCSVAFLQKQARSVVIALNYNEKLGIYSADGKRLSTIPFSSKITTVFMTDLFQEGEAVYVSTDIMGNVRSFSGNGTEIWKKHLSGGIIAGAIGNLDFHRPDPELEIVVVQDNKIVNILDHHGEIVMTYTHPIGLSACTVGCFHLANKEELILSDFDDQIIFLQTDGTHIILNPKLRHITAISTFLFDNKYYLAVADRTRKISFINLEGDIVYQYTISGVARSMSIGNIFGEQHNGIVIVLEDNGIITFEITPLKKKTKSVVDSSEKKMGILEIKTPTTQPQVGDVKVTPQGETKVKCPECGKYLPSEFESRIRNGSDVFCESCGVHLTEEHLKKMNRQKD